MKASDRQVGGDHYRAEYQHWDWSIDIKLGYLESAATKYVTRWRGKNGPQDVEKAIHYLEKAKEAFLEGRLKNLCWFNDTPDRRDFARKATQRFLDANEIGGTEADFMWEAAHWRTENDLSIAIGKARVILRMAVDVQERQGQPVATSTPSQPPGGSEGQNLGASGGVRPSYPTDGWDRTGQEHPFGYDAQEEFGDDWHEGPIDSGKAE